MSEHAETDHLSAAARLFGRLLLRELDEPTLAELRQDDVRAALADLDVTVPRDDQLPALGQRFFELFLHPQGAVPPVQSLWRDGQYDGDPAAGVRRIADAANLQLADAARGAAPDHLGCILLLWAELREPRPELAELLREHHLAWAELALQHTLADDGFYGAVCRACVSLVRALRAGDD
ncbi:MAG: molecular chaperone [Planctomycetota bacterium]